MFESLKDIEFLLKKSNQECIEYYKDLNDREKGNIKDLLQKTYDECYNVKEALNLVYKDKDKIDDKMLYQEYKKVIEEIYNIMMLVEGRFTLLALIND